MSSVSKELTAYLSEIGRKGGKRSRRRLDPEDARKMVRVREARKLFTKYRSTCFWSSPRDFKPGLADLDWVAERLRKYGGREGWKDASRLCH
ncbi:MAG: hypothetical protein ACQKBT_00905 [Puniceicoccales bacterium]